MQTGREKISQGNNLNTIKTTWDPTQTFVRSQSSNLIDLLKIEERRNNIIKEHKAQIAKETQTQTPIPKVKTPRIASPLFSIKEEPNGVNLALLEESVTPTKKLQKTEAIFTELREINNALDASFRKLALEESKQTRGFFSQQYPKPQAIIEQSLKRLTNLLNNFELTPEHIGMIKKIGENAFQLESHLQKQRGRGPLMKVWLNTVELSLNLLITKIQGYKPATEIPTRTSRSQSNIS